MTTVSSHSRAHSLSPPAAPAKQAVVVKPTAAITPLSSTAKHSVPPPPSPPPFPSQATPTHQTIITKPCCLNSGMTSSSMLLLIELMNIFSMQTLKGYPIFNQLHQVSGHCLFGFGGFNPFLSFWNMQSSCVTEFLQIIHASRGGCVMHEHQFW